MEIEVRVIDGCPHVDSVIAALEKILAERGDVVLTIRVLRTPEESEELTFPGSPTILIDGEDPFPSTGAVTGLSCRRFPLPDGSYGVPDEAVLRQVILTHDSNDR